MHFESLFAISFVLCGFIHLGFVLRLVLCEEIALRTCLVGVVVDSITNWLQVPFFLPPQAFESSASVCFFLVDSETCIKIASKLIATLS